MTSHTGHTPPTMFILFHDHSSIPLDFILELHSTYLVTLHIHYLLLFVRFISFIHYSLQCDIYMFPFHSWYLHCMLHLTDLFDGCSPPPLYLTFWWGPVHWPYDFISHVPTYRIYRLPRSTTLLQWLPSTHFYNTISYVGIPTITGLLHPLFVHHRPPFCSIHLLHSIFTVSILELYHSDTGMTVLYVHVPAAWFHSVYATPAFYLPITFTISSILTTFPPHTILQFLRLTDLFVTLMPTTISAWSRFCSYTHWRWLYHATIPVTRHSFPIPHITSHHILMTCRWLHFCVFIFWLPPFRFMFYHSTIFPSTSHFCSDWRYIPHLRWYLHLLYVTVGTWLLPVFHAIVYTIHFHILFLPRFRWCFYIQYDSLFYLPFRVFWIPTYLPVHHSCSIPFGAGRLIHFYISCSFCSVPATTSFHHHLTGDTFPVVSYILFSPTLIYHYRFTIPTFYHHFLFWNVVVPRCSFRYSYRSVTFVPTIHFRFVTSFWYHCSFVLFYLHCSRFYGDLQHYYVPFHLRLPPVLPGGGFCWHSSAYATLLQITTIYIVSIFDTVAFVRPIPAIPVLQYRPDWWFWAFDFCSRYLFVHCSSFYIHDSTTFLYHSVARDAITFSTIHGHFLFDGETHLVLIWEIPFTILRYHSFYDCSFHSAFHSVYHTISFVDFICSSPIPF